MVFVAVKGRQRRSNPLVHALSGRAKLDEAVCIEANERGLAFCQISNTVYFPALRCGIVSMLCVFMTVIAMVPCFVGRYYTLSRLITDPKMREKTAEPKDDQRP